jgi:hypothetical protein
MQAAAPATATSAQVFTKLVEQYAVAFSDMMLMGGIYLAPFILWYLWYGLKRDFEWKIFDFLYVMVCLWVLAALLGLGVLIGSRFGYGELGAVGGIFAFWGLFNILLRLKARKDFRNRF